MEIQKKLSETQFQLLVIKDMAIKNAQQDFKQILNIIATEQGIENLNEWVLSKDGRYLIPAVDNSKQPIDKNIE